MQTAVQEPALLLVSTQYNVTPLVTSHDHIKKKNHTCCLFKAHVGLGIRWSSSAYGVQPSCHEIKAV